MKSSENGFDPYANEADVIIIGKLMIENRVDRVTFSGDVDLTADKAGLARARELHQLLGAIVGKLEARELPDALAPPKIQTVKNPFSG